MELYSDTYYVQRIQNGETECFACLLDRYSQQVYTLIFRVVNNKEDAEELTQDVFMKVFKNIASFRGNSSFSTWIYRIAYNTAISETRKKKQEYLAINEDQLTNLPDYNTENNYEEIYTTNRVSLLEKALEKLEPGNRMIILLFYMQNKSIEEITEITGISQSNIKIKLFRIRKKLYALIKEMEGKK